MARDSETEKLVASADFDGPTKNRRCTDVLMLLLIILLWVAMTALGVFAVSNGDFRLVLFPLDYDGNICGTDFGAINMTDYPYLLYVSNFAGVCVKSCPQLAGQVSDNVSDIGTLVTYGGIYQSQTNDTLSELEADFVQVADYSTSEDVRICTEDACYPQGNPQLSWVADGVRMGFGYAYYVGDTFELLWQCFLTDAAEERIAEQVESDGLSRLAIVDDASQFITKLFADIWAASYYILGLGFGASLVISFVYIFLMRLPLILTTVVWTSIFISIAMLFLGGYYMWGLSTEWSEEEPQTIDDTTIKITQGVSVVLFILGGIVALVSCCLRAQIMVAIGCVKQAGKAINSMTLILLVPVLQAIGLLIFMVVFGYYGVHLASLGEIVVKDIPLDVQGEQVISFRTYEFDDFVSYSGWFLLFCMFWTSNFIVALGDMIISMSVAKWYFTKDKKKIGSWTVLGSIRDTIFYHAGTCAYGSLILSIIQFIRTLIARAQKAAKDADNKLAGAILCCCQCCFACLECCLKFLNKNAYIQCAIFSTAFCKSCRQAFGLIFRNAARVAAITYVSGAVLIVGKLFISAVVTLLSYYFIVENIDNELHSVAGPVALVFLISYWVSDFFMDIFDMAISTILHCLIADEEMFDGAGGNYSQRELVTWVDKNGSYDEAES